MYNIIIYFMVQYDSYWNNLNNKPQGHSVLRWTFIDSLIKTGLANMDPTFN